MNKKLISSIALLLSVFLMACVFNVPVFANELTEAKTSKQVCEINTSRRYGETNVPFYSDKDRRIYNNSSHPPLYITVKNTSTSAFRLCVRMFDPNYSSTTPLWSDWSEGGLAPGQSRTYYVGSNINKVTVRGMVGPGTFSYSY